MLMQDLPRLLAPDLPSSRPAIKIIFFTNMGFIPVMGKNIANSKTRLCPLSVYVVRGVVVIGHLPTLFAGFSGSSCCFNS